MKKEYSFGTAIFDNAQTRHSYENGVSKMVFTAQATPTISATMTAIPVATTKAPAFEIISAISALLAVILVRRR